MQAQETASSTDKPTAKAKRSRATGKSDTTQAAEQQETPLEQGAPVGSGRQAAQGAEYKEKTHLSLPGSKVAVKEEQTAGDELQALEKTQTDAKGPRRQARQSCVDGLLRCYLKRANLQCAG